MHRLLKLPVAILLLLSAALPAIALKPRIDGNHPVSFSTGTMTPLPGETLHCTVYMDDESQTDTTVWIESSDPWMLSNPPSYVIVPAGEDHVSFDLHVSNYAYGAAYLSALANGRGVDALVGVFGN